MLDNAEKIPHASRLVSALLAQADTLKVLVTRVRPRGHEKDLLPLAPLGLPVGDGLQGFLASPSGGSRASSSVRSTPHTSRLAL